MTNINNSNIRTSNVHSHAELPSTIQVHITQTLSQGEAKGLMQSLALLQNGAHHPHCELTDHLGSLTDLDIHSSSWDIHMHQETPIANQTTGRIQPAPTHHTDILNMIGKIFHTVGLAVPTTLPTQHPTTGAAIEWNKSGVKSMLSFITQQNNRTAAQQQTSEEDKKIEDLLNLLKFAISSGNMNMAMLIFSSLESKQATKLNKIIVDQLQKTQEQRTSLSHDLAAAAGNEQKMPDIQDRMQKTNDMIQTLTALLRDVNDQKNRTVEFANNFLSSEHQTTMSIVRGMKG